MKINTLTTRYFKSAPDQTIALGNLNVFIGPNGRGKTSTENALRYLMNGKLPPHPIRHGEDHLQVSAVIDDGQGTTISRSAYLPNTYRIDGVDVKEKAFVAKAQALKAAHEATGSKLVLKSDTNPFFARLADPEDAAWQFFIDGKVEGARIGGIKRLEAEAYDGTTLYALKSAPSKVEVDGKRVTGKAFAEFLRDRIQGDENALDIVTSSATMNAMEMPDFAKYLLSWTPLKVDFAKLKTLVSLTPEEEAALAPCFPGTIGTAEIEAAYKTLFEKRTELGRREDEALKRSVFEGPETLPDKAQTTAALENARQTLGAAAQIEKAWRIYEKAAADRARAVAALDAWKREHAAMAGVSAPDAQMLASLKKTDESLRAAIETDVRAASKLDAACRPLLKMLSSLDATVCPLCDKLVCQTDKTACKADIEAAVAANREVIAETENRIAENRRRDEIARAEIERLHEQSKAWTVKENLRAKIEAFEKTIPAEPTQPQPIPDVAAIKAEADALAATLEQIAIRDECEKARAAYLRLKAERELYASLVKKTEPKKGTLTNAILEYVLTPFCQHANGFLQTVTGDMFLSFRMDDDGLQIYCRPHGKSFEVPVKALSDGEKLLVSFALMDMVSTISNARIVVFDRMEAFDAATIDSLLDALMRPEIASRYDHVILSTVDHSDIAKAVSKRIPFVNVVTF